MNRREAKRRVCAGACRILSNTDNEWLWLGEDGEELPEADHERMFGALDELVAELARRGAEGDHIIRPQPWKGRLQ